VGLFERWDERNQRRSERDNERLGGDDWVARLDAETAGPRWAWAIAGVPVIGWIGDAAIAMVAWRRRWQ
jgi:hypothetical protein